MGKDVSPLSLEARVIENQTFNRQACKLDSSETDYSCTSLTESGGALSRGVCSLLIFIKNAKLILKTGNSKNSLPQTPIKEGQLNALLSYCCYLLFLLHYVDGALRNTLTSECSLCCI